MHTSINVKLATDGKVSTMTLSRPEALNALNLDMVKCIAGHLLNYKNSDQKLLILKGEGRAFCAGGDVKAVTALGKEGRLRDAAEFFRQEYAVNHAIATSKKPIVALIDGITMGGGVGLSVHAPIRVATEQTVFAMPETAIGLFPDVGGSFFLPRLDNKVGLFLALTGARLKGQETLWAGIATHFVPSSRLPLLEERLHTVDTSDIEVLSNVINEFTGEVSYKTFSLGVPEVRDVIESCFSSESILDTFRNLKSRAQDSQFAQRTLDTLMKVSPSSLHITTRQLQEGLESDLAGCFEMEYGLACHALESYSNSIGSQDFYEGVRAMLVDKDSKPQWNPSSVDKVSSKSIDWYFSELPQDMDPLILTSDDTYDTYPHNLGMITEADIEQQFYKAIKENIGREWHSVHEIKEEILKNDSRIKCIVGASEKLEATLNARVKGSNYKWSSKL